jgi:hypothetical protein
MNCSCRQQGQIQRLRCSCAPLTAALVVVRVMAGPPMLVSPAARGAPIVGVRAPAFTLVTARVAKFETGGLAWPNLALRTPCATLLSVAILVDPTGWPDWLAKRPRACAPGSEWKRSARPSVTWPAVGRGLTVPGRGATPDPGGPGFEPWPFPELAAATPSTACAAFVLGAADEPPRSGEAGAPAAKANAAQTNSARGS